MIVFYTNSVNTKCDSPVQNQDLFPHPHSKTAGRPFPICPTPISSSLTYVVDSRSIREHSCRNIRTVILELLPLSEYELQAAGIPTQPNSLLYTGGYLPTDGS